MEKLLEDITALVRLVSPEKVAAISSRVRSMDVQNSGSMLMGVVGTPQAMGAVDRMLDAWKATNITPGELAMMLISASHAAETIVTEQSVELVWTGPTTPFVSTRRTEQALIQVINAADSILFVTSFVAYRVLSVVAALNEAAARGVTINFLLESSQNDGGSLDTDSMGRIRGLVPSAKIYAWIEKDEPFAAGRVHAKIAVADCKICFITSANLTDYAMERNMEAGLLVTGGSIPELLQSHLEALVYTKLVVLM